MLFAAVSVLLATQLPFPPTVPDTALFPPREVLIRLYTDCDEGRWPGMADTIIPKTPEELASGVARRRRLEDGWRAWFRARDGGSGPTAESLWAYPLGVRGRLLNNFANPRESGPHGALDIFVRREGAEVRAPVAGVVVAAGDGWVGGWRRREGLWYEGGGMSRRQGNGLLLFDPASGGYLLFSHLREGVRVQAGDVVRRGQVVGQVGNSGNAAQPGHGRHLHMAFKQAGTACGTEGVLVAVNPYERIRSARQRREAR